MAQKQHDRELCKWHREQVRAYAKHEHPIYKLYAGVLEAMLKHACNQRAPLAIVQARAKSIASFAGKAMRQRQQIPDPAHQLTDLCGGRVIVHTRDQVEQICEFIRGRFVVPETDDVSTRLKTAEFGYLSIHFLVQLRRDTFAGIELPRELGSPRALLRRIGRRTAEIQVRTLLQHVWADVTHDRMYKTRIRVPEAWKHAAARQAALLENADQEFSRMVNQLDAYLLHHDAYMTAAEMRAEIETLDRILANEKPDSQPGTALQIARLARSLRDWPVVLRYLTPFADTARFKILVADRSRGGDREVIELGSILAELGHALCEAHRRQPASEAYRQGQKFLETVGRPEEIDLANLSSQDTGRDELRGRALAWLAESCDHETEPARMACDLYNKASLCNPTDPYHLVSYLEREVAWERRLDLLRPMRFQIESAIRTCAEHAAVRVELPRAYYVTAKLHLLLERYYESLAAYAKAIHISDDEAPIGQERMKLARLRRAFKKGPQELEWIDRFLLVAWHGKTWTLTRKAQQAAEAARHESQSLAGQHEELKNAGVPERTKIRELEKRLARAQGKAAQADAEAADWQRAVDEITKDTELCRLRRNPKPFREPIVIVAGGTDPEVQEHMESYREPLRKAFAGFEGTIISGGTASGIPGLIGDIAARELRRRGRQVMDVIAYAPSFRRRRAPADAPKDRRYTRHIETDGDSFSPLEPLQNWIDMLAAGISPSRVRLLGINGGRIAAFEYQLALAMGATVGIVEWSGRAANDILPDVDFWPPGRLLRLPPDPMTLRAFVNPGHSALDAGQIEQAGRVVHQEYLRNTLPKKVAPALRCWEHLPEPFRDSNRQQVIYATSVLQQFGYCVGPWTRGASLIAFPDKELELMAEMEHGRWNVERLAAGWRYDVKRDDDKLKHDCLVAWRDLPDEIRQYDRDAVSSWPAMFKAAGLAVHACDRGTTHPARPTRAVTKRGKRKGH